MFSYIVISYKYNTSLIFSNLVSSTGGDRERKEDVRNFLMLKRKDFAFTSSSILPMSLDVYKYVQTHQISIRVAPSSKYVLHDFLNKSCQIPSM